MDGDSSPDGDLSSILQVTQFQFQYEMMSPGRPHARPGERRPDGRVHVNGGRKSVRPSQPHPEVQLSGQTPSLSQDVRERIL